MKIDEGVNQDREREARHAQASGGAATQPIVPATRFMIAGEAPVLLGKACELLIKEVSTRAWRHTERNRRRTLQRQDVHAAVGESEVYDFLIDIVPRINAGQVQVNGTGYPEHQQVPSQSQQGTAPSLPPPHVAQVGQPMPPNGTGIPMQMQPDASIPQLPPTGDTGDQFQQQVQQMHEGQPVATGYEQYYMAQMHQARMQAETSMPPGTAPVGYAPAPPPTAIPNATLHHHHQQQPQHHHHVLQQQQQQQHHAPAPPQHMMQPAPASTMQQQQQHLLGHGQPQHAQPQHAQQQHAQPQQPQHAQHHHQQTPWGHPAATTTPAPINGGGTRAV